MPRAPRGSFLRQLPPSFVAVSRCCSSIATCCLPAHIASVVRAFKPAVCQRSNPSSLPAASTKPCGVSLCCSSVAANLPIVKTFKILGRLPPDTLAAGICWGTVAARGSLPSRLVFLRTFLPFASSHTPQMLRGRGFAIAICSYGKRSFFLFHFLFFFDALSGTCQCFIWHGFPDGVTCVTAMRPHDCDDQTTVEHTGQLCA